MVFKQKSLQDVWEYITNDRDETRFVSGYPGKSVVIARRSGDTWYIAGINGTDEEQELALSLKDILQGSENVTAFLDDGERAWIILPKVSQLPSTVICRPRGGFILCARQSSHETRR